MSNEQSQGVPAVPVDGAPRGTDFLRRHVFQLRSQNLGFLGNVQIARQFGFAQEVLQRPVGRWIEPPQVDTRQRPCFDPRSPNGPQEIDDSKIGDIRAFVPFRIESGGLLRQRN